MKKSDKKIAFNLSYKLFIGFLVIISIFIGVCVYLSNVNISSKDFSVNWSSWPVNFTLDFAENITFDDGVPSITEHGKDELDKYHLSIQIIDKDGNSEYGYNEPEGALEHYSPIDIVQVYKDKGNVSDHTMFIGSVNNEGEEWTYIIGFPAKITKVTMYINYDKYLNLKFIVGGFIILMIAASVFYALWMNKVLLKIIEGIKKLACDTYVPIKEKGLYVDIFHNLNMLNKKLKASEEERKKTETLREEWIANISHDLKTPLSPIRGYAEMLSDSDYNLDIDDVNRYGEIILRNAQNLESIVENLNFTYQLKNNMVPIKLRQGNIVRLIKEVIISILNNPKYEERNIGFQCDEASLDFDFDDTLLRRAFTNILCNEVIHNPDDTVINVSVKLSDKLYITIEDNGRGMAEEDVKKLFERYYRGTNSSENIKGSGLGMSIAKQIIEAHRGKIRVESQLGVGTRIYVEFSYDKRINEEKNAE